MLYFLFDYCLHKGKQLIFNIDFIYSHFAKFYNSLLFCSLGFSRYIIISFKNYDSLILSILIYTPLISSPHVIALSRTISRLLNNRGLHTHPYLVLDFNGNVIDILPFLVQISIPLLFHSFIFSVLGSYNNIV